MKTALTIIGLCAAFMAGIAAERFLAQDACLDNGGVYNHGICFTDKPMP
ncbi:hypothetical protein LVJ83_05905 [Uruburuella testudinis]|uniref:Uncharacterized protein n=1 Tax=Uruburuella testudinis TaxID=1282863 RepID=A0ABY4DVD7_9NEIS|nr:hypothetical protein [Uruburuella testudinis]UOO82990.1 hypothetical protein LVJ83_05905 [Uruburuella testudinis]